MTRAFRPFSRSHPLRDVVIAVALLFVTWRCRQQAQRSAFWLRGQPANLLFYLPGSPWQMANDVPVGSIIRIEFLDDPVAQAAQAGQYPEASFAQPLVDLAIGDDTVLSVRESVVRADAAQQRWRWASPVAGLAALGWIGWAGWRWRGKTLI